MLHVGQIGIVERNWKMSWAVSQIELIGVFAALEVDRFELGLNVDVLNNFNL